MTPTAVAAKNKSPKKASTYTAMRAALAKYRDVDKATHAYLASLTVNELRSQLYPHVRNSMRLIDRGQTRRIEEKLLGAQSAGRESVVLSDLAEFIGKRFALPDGSLVETLKATVAQHAARAEWQRNMAAGSLRDAERHELAIAMIEEAGVTCLGEIKK